MTDQPIREADHEARERANDLLDAEASGVPLWDAIVALDTLAILAGIPAPGSTVHLPEEVTREHLTADTREELAAVALRRAAAWAAALVEALPEQPA